MRHHHPFRALLNTGWQTGVVRYHLPLHWVKDNVSKRMLMTILPKDICNPQNPCTLRKIPRNCGGRGVRSDIRKKFFPQRVVRH